jgi:hypothetical protein
MTAPSTNTDLSIRLQIIHDSQTQTILVPWAGQNVQQILEDAYNRTQNHATFSFGLEFFGTYQNEQQGGPLGYLVTMVDGIYDLPPQQVYWELLIDGQSASKGIGSTYPPAGSTVTLQNIPYSEDAHRGTVLEKKHRVYMARINRSRAS